MVTNRSSREGWSTLFYTLLANVEDFSKTLPWNWQTNVIFAAGEIPIEKLSEIRSSGVHNAIVCSCDNFLESTVNCGKIYSILRSGLRYSKRF